MNWEDHGWYQELDASRRPNAFVLSVHDGDTLRAAIDIRFRNANARELREPGGIEARENLAGLLLPGTPLHLRDLRPDFHQRRFDADVFYNGDDLIEELIAAQWLARYPGYGPKVNPPFPREV